MSKKKILLISDSPYSTSGLGRMARYFMEMLPEYQWIHWGVNHPKHEISPRYARPIYDINDFNGDFKIISPQQFGDQKDPTYAFSYLTAVIKQEKPDYVITSIDYNRIVAHFETIQQLKMVIGFKWINYFPVDREYTYASELQSFKFPDVNVCISKFGVNKIKEFDKKVKIDQIYHPIDAAEFPEVDNKEINEFKQKYYGGVLGKKDFLVGTVNRNFARKDPVRTLDSFIKFNKKNPRSMMYFHGSRITYEGHDLTAIANQLGITPQKLIFPSVDFAETDGYPQEVLNKIYRTFDLFTTSSMGEGFGFTTVEAMLCEVPIIAPKNTTFPELVQDFGYLVDTKDWVFFYNNYDVPWPIVDQKDFVDTMQYVYDNKEETKEKTKKGREWVIKNLNLNTIRDQWKKILK